MTSSPRHCLPMGIEAACRAAWIGREFRATRCAMRPLLVLALLLSAPARAAAPLRAVCTWTDARWEHGATLYLPGTGLAYGNADPGDGVTLNGTLGLDDLGLVRFRVKLSGAGLAVTADTQPNEDPIFHLVDGALPLGPAGTLVPSGMLSVVGTRGRAVLVAPFHWAAESVVVPDAVGLAPCEHISVHWAAAPDPKAALKAAGFSKDLPEKWLRPHHGTRLADAPSGRTIGRIRGSRFGVELRVAGEKDGWAHVALPDWTGVVWHGWIRARGLANDEPGGTGIGGLGLAGTGLDTASLKVRRCQESVPLHARVGPLDMEIGKVAAGTPMQIRGERYGHLSVTFPGSWLHPASGAVFLVSEAVQSCPEGTWSRPKDEDIPAPASK